MLFDLRGKRKRVIQVIYAGLAILMGGGLVLFGIGGDVSGGLFDAFRENRGAGAGLGGEVGKIEKRLAVNPRDRGALEELTRAHFQLANSGTNVDQELGTYSEQGKQELEKAADAWERYLKTRPKPPDTGVALLVVRAYEALEDYKPAARTQTIVARARPSRGAFLQLATFRYFARQFGPGDRAAERTIALSPAEERSDVRRQLRLVRFGQQAVAFYLDGLNAAGDRAARKAIAAAPADRRKELRRQLKDLKKQVEAFLAVQAAKGGQQALPEGVPPPPGSSPIPPNSPFAFPQGGQLGVQQQ